jgi:drug/metabolite transporter (DMT)-like permease
MSPRAVSPSPLQSPLGRGVLLAFGAAALFGATTPLLQRASAAVGPFAAASLIYLGAGLTAAVLMAARRRRPDAPLGGRALLRLAAVALIGAALAPTLLVLGLRRTDAATGSLLLALEAPFTLALSRLFLRERLSARVGVAMALIGLGGLALTVAPGGATASWLGPALVAGATFAWAAENLLSRSLADGDPLRVVRGKGLMGSAAAAVAAVAAAQTVGSPGAVAALLAIGGVGYGLSLQLYLRAQRLVGAARTASVFAAAPFFGAIIALALGGPAPGPRLAAAALLIAAGVWLHVTEHHSHHHTHGALEHEHLHTHDDGHHDHPHIPMPAGAHSHLHRHEAIEHEHEHGEDLHHRHTH